MIKAIMTQNERMILPIWKKIIVLILTLIVFALQIALFVFLFQVNFSNELNTTIFFLLEGYALIIVLHIIHKPMLTSYKLTWSILIMFLPLPFSIFYYLNHRSRRLPRYKQKKIDEILFSHKQKADLLPELAKIDSKAAKHARILYANTGLALYKNTKFTFLFDGYVKFQDLLIELRMAEKYIFIECFIIADGYLLNQLLPILEEKGQAGLEIKIIYDDLGSRTVLKGKTVKRLANIPNCQLTNYNPLGLNINPAFNYRDHRKIIIIDGKTAYCGGDNLADEYIHQKQRFGFWRDNCGKYEGDAVETFLALFSEMWYMSTKNVIGIKNYIYDNKIINNTSYVMPFGDGPSNATDPGYEIFKSLISSADKTINISTPYFIIDDSMIELIALAAKSGVQVKILMPGIPDKKAAFYLAKSHYREILKAGGAIYEYEPGFNHAKNIIIDGKYAFIGTINMDYRSLFLHYECGAIILLDDEIKKMEVDFEAACEKSKLVTYEEWKKRPWWQKLISYILYIVAPMF